MSQKSLGIIETIGLSAAVEAADTALKSADVELVGYELTKGSGMTVVKVEGNVGAVKAAIDAAAMAAARMGTVVSAKVIPRPSPQIEILVRNSETVGCKNAELQREEPQCEEQGVSELPSAKLESAAESKSEKLGDVSELEYEKLKGVLESLSDQLESVSESPSEELESVSESPSEELRDGSAEGFEEPDAGSEPERYTCNLCRDPKCPRQKGDLKQLCIHYRKKK